MTRVTLAWGGLSLGWTAAGSALPLQYDVLIGGAIIDCFVRFARDHNVAVIGDMDQATQWEAMRRLGRKAQEKFPSLKLMEFDNGSPWTQLA